jgi:MoaA/NifB/PqqE/SkfB family radical SAM enzyme
MAADAPIQLDPYRRLLNKAFEKAIPLNCQIELTYRCNHLCTFCYNSPTGEREMTTEQVFEVLRKVADFGVVYVTLTGGEAMCRKDFFPVAQEVRRLGMAVRIYSNGFLLADPKMVEKVRALDPMEVEISVHGAKPETHDALTRIKGSFEKTWQGIRNLVDAGIAVRLKCPITRLNQAELFDLRDLGETLGQHVIFDAVITPKDDGSQDPLALRADDEIIEKYWVEWYSELHRGQLPPRTEDESLRLGRGGQLRHRALGLHDRPLREPPPVRRLPPDDRQSSRGQEPSRRLEDVARPEGNPRPFGRGARPSE